ncbi:hypothetical protein ACI8AA_23405 [Geodermatophilus sp. SYSU D01180]
MTRRLLTAAAPLALAAALTACTTTVPGTATGAVPLTVLTSTVVTGSTGGLVSGVTVTGEEVLLLVAGPYGGAGLTVVDPTTGEVPGEVPLPEDTQADVVLVTGGGTLVAGGFPAGYAVAAVDPRTGRVTGTTPVAPFPADAVGTVAVATPDGGLLVGVQRADGVPVVLHVDPATGAVTGTAELRGLAGLAEGTGRFAVDALAPTPDGGVVVSASVPREGRGPSVAVLARLGADLAPVGEPVVLLPDAVASTATGLAVGPDGTAYTVVAPEDSGPAALVALAPGADAPARVAVVDAAPAALSVVDGALWVLHDRVALTRVDLADGAVTGRVELCADGTADGLGVGSDGALVAVTTCDRATVWRVER